MKLEKGMLIELAEDLAVDITYLRWGTRFAEEHFLIKGRYIVDHAAPGEVRLAHADWDPQGNVTFHSTKHGMMIKGRRSVAALAKAAQNYFLEK